MDFSNTRRNKVCPCGSGKKFKHCHGNLEKNLNFDEEVKAGMGHNGYYQQSLLDEINSDFIKGLPISSVKGVPPGVLVIENFIEDELCQKIIEMTERSRHVKATVVESSIDDASKHEEILESERKTEIFFLEQYDLKVKSIYEKVFKGAVNQFFNKKITCYEQPHILRYSKGGFYNYHADSETWDDKQKKWYKSMQRDLSFLLYLNDDYEGGELVFKNLRFDLKPKKGMFVGFPSDHRFIHKVMPTLSGLRYAIVSWAAIEETMKDMNLSPSTNRVVVIK